MGLAPLKFKGYVWPHNPSIYSIRFTKDVIKHRYPGLNNADLEDLGMDARVFIGSGAFFGPNAYDQFKELATVFYDKGPGMLIHPIWMPTKAIFVRLEAKQEPTPNYVEYEFEFIEHVDIQIIQEIKSTETPNSGSNSNGSTNSTNNKSNVSSSNKNITYTVKQGDTLSGIGAKFGVPWKNIANANKNLIKDPNMIQIGWKLTIPNPTKNPSSNNKTNSKKTYYTGGIGSGRPIEGW